MAKMKQIYEDVSLLLQSGGEIGEAKARRYLEAVGYKNTRNQIAGVRRINNSNVGISRKHFQRWKKKTPLFNFLFTKG